MNKAWPKLLLFSLFFTACRQMGNQPNESNPFRPMVIQYPDTYRDTSVVDDYFGLKISDPYRWLEDPNSNATKNWIKAQRSITDQFFNVLPFRAAIRQRLTKIWNHERFTPPVVKGNKKFLLRNDGLQDQDVLCQLLDEGGSVRYEEILNPNKLSVNRTTSLNAYRFSSDGSLLAFQLAEGGSDWNNIYIHDMNNNTLLRDTIRWVKFSDIAWSQDGFFYSRYPAPAPGEALSGSNQFHQVFFHRVGTPQSQDELVFADRTNPQLNFNTQVSEDGRYIFLTAIESASGNALYFRDLRNDSPDFEPIVTDFKHDFQVVGSDRNNFFVLTNYKAPRQRVVRINATRPGERYWEEVIPQGEDLLTEVKFYNNKLVAHYLHNVSSQLKVYNINGRLQGEAQLPGLGSVTEFSGAVDQKEAYFSFTSFTQPATIYRLDLDNLNISEFLKPRIDFDGSLYETKQVWYDSYDGTKIPMFIIHKKGLDLNGQNPTLLYGYGGFNSATLPIFNRTRLNLFPIMLENNGVCAVANIRGGGEFGADWHQAGTLLKKQNVFDDFQAAAEYLIANKYTDSKKLAIYGRSNGGLLVGACLTQRPDLYAVAIPAVGVLDMLRYHKFTIGWAWATDYGTSEQESEFDYLYAYSPLHNIIDAKYPATLITTADHDDRVVPAHSFKFGAKLQTAQKGPAPVLIRIDSDAGHGTGNPVSKRIDEGADILSFIFYNMKQPLVYDWQSK